MSLVGLIFSGIALAASGTMNIGAGNGINQLTSEVTAGPGSGPQAATVVSVGGSSASAINAATVLANAATSANTASAIVLRDASKNFAANVATVARVKSNGTAPTALVNSNAGVGASCSVSNATDMAGTISLTTGAVASLGGAECAVTFSAAMATAPICILMATNANAINFAVIQGVFLTTSTTVLTLNFATADAVGRAYTWAYQCVETQ